MVAQLCGYAAAEPRDRLMEGKKEASSDIKRRNFLVRSMPISVKSLSGPHLFIFQACELMGGKPPQLRASNYSHQVGESR